MISPNHSISTPNEDNVIDIIYVGELEIHTVLTYHCATSGPLPIALYLALTAKNLGTPLLKQCPIRIVLVQLYIEPANDFNLLLV